MRTGLMTMVLGILLSVGQAFGYTWYVDDANGNDANDGYSWSSPFATITNALADLAATNAVLGNTGGHLILITNGTYNDGSVDLEGEHNGAPGNPNELRAVDDNVRIQAGAGGGESYNCMNINYLGGSVVSNITIDGVFFRGGYETLEAWECTNVVFRNVIFEYSGLSYGHILGRTYASMDFTNCVFGFAGGGGIYLNNTRDINIKNCVIFCNQNYGIYHYSSADRTLIANCLIYQNGWDGANVTVYNGSGYVTYNTHAEISTDRYFDLGSGNYLAITNCVSKNPGYANRMGYRDGLYQYDVMYDNSPLLGAGEGGQNIGPSQNPTLVTVPGSPVTYYVSQTGNDSDGLSWGNAFDAISDAAAVAVAGDTVLVDTGTYSGNVTIENGGGDGLPLVYEAQGDVLIDGTVYMYGVSGVTFDGFEVDGGTYGVYVDYVFENSFIDVDTHDATYGMYVGLFCTSNGFSNCRFRDNADSGFYSFGMQYGPGRNVFRDCSFYNNLSTYFDTLRGGAVVRSADNMFVRCASYGNTQNGFHSSNNSSGITRLYNCLAYSNGLRGINAMYPVEIANCTVYANGDWGIRSRGTDNTCVNTIIAGNGDYGAVENEQWDLFAKNCLYWNNGADLGSTTNHFMDSDGSTWTNILGTAADIDTATGCEGSVVADPRFADTGANNYRLQSGSGAIDAADASLISTTYFPDSIVNRDVDFDGNTRVKMTALDIGAYEWQPPMGTLFMVR